MVLLNQAFMQLFSLVGLNCAIKLCSIMFLIKVLLKSPPFATGWCWWGCDTTRLDAKIKPARSDGASTSEIVAFLGLVLSKGITNRMLVLLSIKGNGNPETLRSQREKHRETEVAFFSVWSGRVAYCNLLRWPGCSMGSGSKNSCSERPKSWCHARF